MVVLAKNKKNSINFSKANTKFCLKYITVVTKVTCVQKDRDLQI